MLDKPRYRCDHKCHKVGLNAWVRECPICGCPNPKFDEAAEPDIWGDFTPVEEVGDAKP
jgi:hypothetical protein